MLWNWNTIDACFISSSWHIRSHGMFAGSCIGIILLVMCLEFLRRAGQEYDRFLVRIHRQRVLAMQSTNNGTGGSVSARVSPTVFQQVVRAFLHLCQFAVAYFIMLLAMYFNGYIIICIFIGAFIGSFIFSWDTLNLGIGEDKLSSVSNEPTVCCG
ncbi:hypothetical protein ASPZODRAFT_94284 [Penicilliopsis zonata CBS 506.65]|uniref:Copper transport protein n=1 Tax=Penicilliopsis zonata CBS 506.65 TaxID=1073090 RepID=A0A1L9SK93_9EURO|nr:hypothetical protein ASPZODRAFT_94284 [Penicilliopsis zonata CBS 506.65]OJJ47630.1 hypothetical protein ASPZODRAFT_94284 [Penicilliopsis zonata CBS 506.65]